MIELTILGGAAFLTLSITCFIIWALGAYNFFIIAAKWFAYAGIAYVLVMWIGRFVIWIMT